MRHPTILFLFGDFETRCSLACSALQASLARFTVIAHCLARSLVHELYSYIPILRESLKFAVSSPGHSGLPTVVITVEFFCFLRKHKSWMKGCFGSSRQRSSDQRVRSRIFHQRWRRKWGRGKGMAGRNPENFRHGSFFFTGL